MLMCRVVWVFVGMCWMGGASAHAVEMMVGGLGGARDGEGLPLVVEFGAPSPLSLRTRGALASVLTWKALVDDVATRVGVDRALLMAVIDVESGGNPFAVSRKGARGLMQLMPRTGLAQGADHLFDPYQNVVAGARLLGALLTMFGDVSLALAAYNAGEGAVRKFGGIVPPYAETQSYVHRVMQRVSVYRE